MNGMRSLVTLLVLFVAAGVIATAAMGGIAGPGLMHRMMWGYTELPTGSLGAWGWGAMMGLGWTAMIAFWGALIVSIALLVRWVTGLASERRPGATQEEPLTILQRRYARGEIDAETYEQTRRDLAA